MCALLIFTCHVCVCVCVCVSCVSCVSFALIDMMAVGMQILKGFYSRIGYEFLVMLPESIPYLAEVVEDEKIEEYFRLLDTNNDNTVEFAEFVTFMAESQESHPAHVLQRHVDALKELYSLVAEVPEDEAEEGAEPDQLLHGLPSVGGGDGSILHHPSPRRPRTRSRIARRDSDAPMARTAARRTRTECTLKTRTPSKGYGENDWNP